MNDLPLNGLMQQMHAHPHTGEHLEVLGKRAAAAWGAGEHETMTEAVTSIVKQAQLSPEQVRRVVEFANTSAFLTEFKKEGAPHHVVDFVGGPADAQSILQDLNDGGGGSVYDRGTGDYNSPPTEGASTKTASDHTEEALVELFGKEAPAALPFANPHGEVIDLKDKLAGVADMLGAQVSQLEVMYADLGDRLYQQVKQASLGGVSLGEVMAAWQTVTPSDEHVKVAFTLITPRLLREGVFHTVDAMTDSVDKTAGARMVNPEHPLVVEFGEFCDTLSKLAEVRETRKEVRGQLDHLTNYLKTAAGGVIGKTWQAAGEVGKRLSPLGRAVGGETGAMVARHLPRAALVGAGALGAHEANEHIENSPGRVAGALRGGKHLIEQNIPGTARSYQHKWEIQNGQ